MRLWFTFSRKLTRVFQSTHPVWDATAASSRPSCVSGFQSTHPVWDATPVDVFDGVAAHISIHASRMGCDFFQSRSLSFQLHFNPRIPYGMRLGRARRTCCPYVFQSTHPVWDATGHIGDVHSDLPISIHASRMGCDAHVRSLRAVPVISIHASRMGCDAALVSGAGRHQQFQSTHPVWDATVLVRPKDAPE